MKPPTAAHDAIFRWMVKGWEGPVLPEAPTDAMGAIWAFERAKTLAGRYGGSFGGHEAAQAFGEHLAHTSTEHMIDCTEADRRRIFNLGYFTWVEQQGTPFELFEQRRSQGFWRGLRRYVQVWDDMIDDLNAQVARDG